MKFQGHAYSKSQSIEHETRAPFWLTPDKIEVITTSFIEVLELQIFGQMTTYTI